MPQKKNARSNKSSHTGRDSTKTKIPGHPERYEGYDEGRTSNNPSYQDDFDVDETDIDQRKSEYDDYTPGKYEK
jgi:hypothetical protein